jgi:hypothetical protein
MILRYILIFLAVFSNASFAQPTENRVALVLGNSAYKSAPLRNPTNDAKDMAAKLKGMGFTVVERNNLTVKQIGSTLREFRSKLTPGSVALVFYAGHGLQIKGENYFPTVDAEIAGEEDVPNQSLSMRQIMDVLGDAKTRLNLVFLDACRDNPYARSFRSASRGLSKETPPSGTLISFATRPGSVASDGTGRNGLYTGALLASMDVQGLQIELALKRVVSAVKGASGGQQEPWTEGSIEGDFYFSPSGIGAGTQVATIATAPSPLGGGFSLDDLRQQQDARSNWVRWQAGMKTDFDKVSTLNVDPELHITAWNRFLSSYKDKNPFSDEDERLRSDARNLKQIVENERQRRLARVSVPVQAPVVTAAPPPSLGGLNSAIEAELRRLTTK